MYFRKKLTTVITYLQFISLEGLSHLFQSVYFIMLLIILLCMWLPSSTSILQTHVCNEQLECQIRFPMVMPTNTSQRTCHCLKNEFLQNSPRFSIQALENSCKIDFLTVFPSDNGVWQCQTPETREKSEPVNLDIVGRLGSPTIEDNPGMIFVNKHQCHSFRCEAKIGFRAGAQLTWLKKNSGTEIMDYVYIENSLSDKTDKDLTARSTIKLCVKEDLDLSCKVTSSSGKFRLSFPLRLVLYSFSHNVQPLKLYCRIRLTDDKREKKKRIIPISHTTSPHSTPLS